MWDEGKRLWKSALVSNFDPVPAAAVYIAGVPRLRLVFTADADDNRFYLADWAEAVLERLGWR